MGKEKNEMQAVIERHDLTKITYFTAEELARRWHCSPETVRAWTRKGKIRGMRPGRTMLYPSHEVIAFETKLFGKV